MSTISDSVKIIVSLISILGVGGSIAIFASDFASRSKTELQLLSYKEIALRYLSSFIIVVIAGSALSLTYRGVVYFIGGILLIVIAELYLFYYAATTKAYCLLENTITKKKEWFEVLHSNDGKYFSVKSLNDDTGNITIISKASLEFAQITSNKPSNIANEESTFPDNSAAKLNYLSNRLDDQITWYDKKSAFQKKWFYISRTITTLLSASIPVMTGFVLNYHFLLWIISIFAAVVGVIESLGSMTKLQEKWIEYRSISENLKHEKYMYLMSAGLYSEKEDKEKLALLTSRVETLISQENNNWSNLDSNQKQGDKK